MPERAVFKEENFETLERTFQEMGFRRITDVEFQTNFRRFGLVAPTSRFGREVGFIFTANDLTVHVWTTWLGRESRTRRADEAWVLIECEDKAVYFSHPLHRTKNFMLNLLRQAWIARWRVLNRPLCPKCRNFMDIVHGRGLKSRYWSCIRTAAHADQKPAFLDWDYGLPPKAKYYVRTLRRKRHLYEKQRRAEGKPLHVALLTRKPWQGVFQPED